MVNLVRIADDEEVRSTVSPDGRMTINRLARPDDFGRANFFVWIPV
jgi:hypothetical protein